MLGEAGIHILYSMALGVPPLKAGRLPSIPTVCAESTGTLPAPYGGLVPPGLNVPAVAAPSFTAMHREMPGAANCWISTSSPTRWRRPVQGHLVDCCWKGVLFAAVIAANQPLCQLNAERLQVHSRPTPSWPALPRQDEGIGNAAVYEEPKDVPVVSKSTFITC